MSSQATTGAEKSRDSRALRARPLDRRLAGAETLGTILFFAAAAVLGAVAGVGHVPVLTVLVYAIAIAIASNVRFDVGAGFTVPTQAVFVPMLFALPPALVPLVTPVALAVGMLPSVFSRRISPSWLLTAAGNSWFVFGPVLVLLATGETSPDGRVGILVAALLAQFAFDFGAAAIRDRLFEGTVDPIELAREAAPIYAVDIALSALGILAALATAAGYGELPVLLIAPLFLLMRVFSRERLERLEHLAELNDAYQGTALLLGDVVESDDSYTGEHSKSVVRLALDVAAAMGLDASRLRNVEFGALLHDVGKIAIPNEIINKPGKLNEREWEIVKTHTIEGQRMLEKIGGVMVEVGRIVRASHEHWDGSGYPDGLAGEAIPVEARIVSACDAFNAMTTTRSYRRAMPLAAAVAEMEACAGSQFDPGVVAALLEVVAAEEALRVHGADAREPIAVTDPPPVTSTDWRPRARNRELIASLADLAVNVGANVQPGQVVEVSAEIGHLETVRAIVESAYAAGARYVDVQLVDPVVQSVRVGAAPEQALGEVPGWETERVRELARRRGASILVAGPTYPGLFDQLDPRRVARAGTGPSAAWREATASINWTIVPAATEGWATALRPSLPIDEAVDALWGDLAHVCRLDQPDPVAAWCERLDLLRRRSDWLTGLELDIVRLRGPDTELRIGLFPGARWERAAMTTPDGLPFVPNLPTEEVYTTPDPARVDGRVRLSAPVAIGGRQIGGAVLRFEAGRVVEIEGAVEVEALREYVDRDDGAARLGELALVDAESRVAQLGETFGETLLDENAACHIALGYGFPGLVPATGRARVNASDHHLDLMIGCADLEVEAFDREGRIHRLLSAGRFAERDPDRSAAPALEQVTSS